MDLDWLLAAANPSQNSAFIAEMRRDHRASSSSADGNENAWLCSNLGEPHVQTGEMLDDCA